MSSKDIAPKYTENSECRDCHNKADSVCYFCGTSRRYRRLSIQRFDTLLECIL